jgi:hypothetical protein
METLACKALVAFTQFVPDYGQVHGDPDNKLKEAQNPLVPTSHIVKFADQGLIEIPKRFKVEEEVVVASADDKAPA